MKYPVYIPSKGRSQPSDALTIKALRRDAVPFYLVVEPQERAAYERLAGADSVLVLPFSNLGQGSIPARNWIRDHAEAVGHARHWQLDDNISMFYRSWGNFRVPVSARAALGICEEFTDRFENVGVSGLNYDMFVTSTAAPPAFYRGVHVYSCTLINHEMPARWRGRYNEDTDLCLQALSSGWATILVNAFMAKKTTTMMMKGGNTDVLYREDAREEERDTLGRFEMARALERAWPGVVRVVRKFERYQHSVNWKAFDIPLRLNPGIDLEALPEIDERGLTLRVVKEVKSPRIRALLESYPEMARSMPLQDPLWRGLPAFRTPTEPLKLRVRCVSTEDRDALVSKLGVLVDKKYANKGWSAWWPPRGRDDPASLRFDYAEAT